MAYYFSFAEVQISLGEIWTLVKGTFFPQNDVILFKITSSTYQKKDACFSYLFHQVVLFDRHF